MARYMYGSEAPARYVEEPVRRRRINPNEEEYIQEQKRQKVEENRQKATKIGGLFTVFVVGMMAVLLVTCIKYIKLINSKNENAKQIASMEEQLQEQKEANDVKELSINTSIDYIHIYNTAVDELGMVYADSDQIIRYKTGESQYVMQYKDIPEN